MIYGVLYLISIVIANLAVCIFGVISVGPLVFPAGAVVIGMTFTARDYVQREYGKVKCWYWMITATIISAVFSLDIAIASVTAFLVSEFVDWLIFTYVGGSFRRRILLSNLFGIPLDSLIFVPLVFGWIWPAIIGQAVVKFVSSLIIMGRK